MKKTFGRRAFLSLLGMATAATLLPEPTVFTPPAGGWYDPVILVAGDCFTVPGVMSVNPVTQKSTGFPQVFVATREVRKSAKVVDLCPRPLDQWTADPRDIKCLSTLFDEA